MQRKEQVLVGSKLRSSTLVPQRRQLKKCPANRRMRVNCEGFRLLVGSAVVPLLVR